MIPTTPVDEQPNEDVQGGVYALIIGINEYQNPQYKNLHGAVADADEMEEYVLNHLQANPDNIISLRNATRKEMLDGFHKLDEITKDTINPCIIVFYAGHGARAQRPSGWEAWAVDSDMIEMLCPSDLGMPIPGVEEDYVEGILDRTVASLLNSLAASRTRGNNITLILDCCCSAGMSRAEDDPMYIPRSIPEPPRISSKTKSHPIFVPTTNDGVNTEAASESTRAVVIAPGFGGMSNHSHVLLAACRRDRKAYEREGRGMFTKAILKFLTEDKNFREHTYNSMMDNLQMPVWQTPHCLGLNADRPLFNPKGGRLDPSYIACKTISLDDNDQPIPEAFTMLAGLAEGIALGERFSIHERVPPEGQKTSKSPIGVMIAGFVGTTSTVLRRLPGQKAPTSLPAVFYARRIDWRIDPPAIYCTDIPLLRSVHGARNGQLIAFNLVDSPEKAALILTADGENDVHLDRTDPDITAHIPSRFPWALKRDSPGEIQTIIGAWRNFNYHLKRKGQDEFPLVRMELHYLEPADGDWDGDNFHPKGSNLLLSEPTEVEVPDPDEGDPSYLGMTLYNDSDIAVYPYLFYFDPTELTITPWALAAKGAGSGAVDAPLLPHSQLSVGYGSGGVDPWQFYFEGDRTKDVGFFKLFLSCSPANFLCLAQPTSPFKRLKDFRGDGPTPPTEAEMKELEKLSKLDKDSWGIKMATVVQIRK
ncbi:caspase domain-containing protein [Ephemerocybe angulata]|uniref:Caspase domain-containing protein n=1 Tax=Ephemerocybe angulata TaxID=980116 RepID=A0A8H6M259_9AGAR|nr:caspase domain-containing protein [Tulosesus angulatus]